MRFADVKRGDIIKHNACYYAVRGVRVPNKKRRERFEKRMKEAGKKNKRVVLLKLKQFDKNFKFLSAVWRSHMSKNVEKFYARTEVQIFKTVKEAKRYEVMKAI